MTKNYSMKDIARLSGVSIATVSRVINNNGRFSEDTRKKVEKVIEETGYQMNYSAKSLRMNRSFSIGILVPDITNYFFAEVVQKIEESLFNQNYSSIICNANRDPVKEKTYLNILESKGVDGLIVISGQDPFDYDSYSNSEKVIPYVCINREPKNNNDTIFISSDDYQGAFDATEELIRMGCTHPVIAMHERQSPFGDRRFKGFKDALEKNGISFNKDSNYLYIDRNHDNIELHIKNYIKEHPSIDGIFAFTDKIAMELLLSFRKLSINVPRDIKVIGYDDTPQSKFLTPTLSSVKQNTDKIASVAVESLLNLIDNPKKSGETILIPVSLSLRESSQIS